MCGRSDHSLIRFRQPRSYQSENGHFVDDGFGLKSHCQRSMVELAIYMQIQRKQRNAEEHIKLRYNAALYFNFKLFHCVRARVRIPAKRE